MKKERYRASKLLITKARQTKEGGLAFQKQAMAADVYSSDYSKILNHNLPLKKDDPRLLRIGALFGLTPDQCQEKVVGLKPEECFTQDPHVGK